MATQRQLVDYPPEYFELFLRASRERVEVVCADSDAAKRFRGRLYAFREALFSFPEGAPRQALVASLIRFAVDGNTLIAQPYEDCI